MAVAQHELLAAAGQSRTRWGSKAACSSRRRSSSSRIVGGAMVAVLLCAGFVGQRVYLMNLSYRLEAETARVHRLAQENEFLQLQVARARSLDRIEALARGRLGMVPAGQRDVVLVPPTPAEPTLPSSGTPTVASRRVETHRGGWLSALLEWAHDRWPGRAAEAGSAPRR